MPQQDNIQDIIGNVPNALIKYGMLLIISLLLLFALAGWFIKVPDKLLAKVVLTTVNPPTNIIAKKNGKIISLLRKDNDTIESNNTIAVIESDGKQEDIDWLNLNIPTFKNFQTNPIIVNNLLNSKVVISGEISNDYNTFAQYFRSYYVAINDKTKTTQIANLQTQLTYRTQLESKLKEQSTLASNQVELENKQYERTTILYDKKVNALKDVQDEQKILLAQQSQHKSTEINLLNNSLSIAQIKAQIDELKNTYIIQKKEAENNVIQSLSILENELYKYQKNYVLQSSTNGIISFGTVWNVNQQVKAGQIIATVSSDEQQTIGKITLPIYNTGKLKVCNDVWIKLDNYPYEKNGILKTKVASISQVPFDGNYIVTVYFPKQLITTYHKQIPNKPEMNGTAEIILSDERLFKKLLTNIIE